jgi:hypothetical protein
MAKKKTAAKTEENAAPITEETKAPVIEQPEETKSPISEKPEEIKEETLSTDDNDNNSSIDQDESVELSIDDQPLTIVIPYLKNEASDDELLYALRTWEKNLPNCKVIIVGDSEEYFSGEVVHVAHEKTSKNPQIDVTHKLLVAIASGRLPDRFVLSNDDIFPLGEVLPPDIYTLKAFGTLGAGTGKSGGVYNENAVRTADLLKEQGFPIHRYGTHTPMLLYTKELAELIDLYEAESQGTLLTSLYFNTYYPTARPTQVTGGKDDPILASVYRSNVEAALLKEVFAKRKFMNVNNDGWKAVKPYFEKMYPNKSRFEK